MQHNQLNRVLRANMDPCSLRRIWHYAGIARLGRSVSDLIKRLEGNLTPHTNNEQVRADRAVQSGKRLHHER